MAAKRRCKLCGGVLKASVAAHDCPHGEPCRYRCRADGLPVDWESPECTACAEERARGGGALGLTPKAWALLEQTPEG